ncbi:MAG: sugar-binding protein, partial [Butyrivibrio sp.]|nr:sugar-binding protein [Butyrivibrio sp.]
MRGFKFLSLITIDAFLFLSLVACGKTPDLPRPEGDTSVSEEEALTSKVISYDNTSIQKIGISMPALNLERWTHDGQYLKEEFESKGYDVEIFYGDNLIDTQINQINNLIDDGSDLLIIAPVDSDSLKECIEKADENKIPVIAYDRLINHAPNLLAYVSYDNYEVGKLQAQYIIEALGLDKGTNVRYNLEIFAGDPVDNNAKVFYDGAMDTLEPYFESGNLSVPSGQTDFYSCSHSSWSSDLAETRMQIILASYYPDKRRLDAVLSSNDSLAYGVTNALQDYYTPNNSVIITGQDCDSAII